MENNFLLTGDEARLIMAALASSNIAAPTAATLSLYMRLTEISQVQPQTMKEESNE